MKPPTPPKVSDVFQYFSKPPPEPSARLLHWKKKFEDGFIPNRRNGGQMGYSVSAQWYGVYIWEYLNVISPMIDKARNK